jgi:hypothetical protein
VTALSARAEAVIADKDHSLDDAEKLEAEEQRVGLAALRKEARDVHPPYQRCNQRRESAGNGLAIHRSTARRSQRC